jgi:hypothetical protein
MDDKRPPMPTNFSWYSICSAHSAYNPECGNCNTGQWVNDEYRELEHWLYEQRYELWHKWANRETSPGEPGHWTRTFLERVFPRLKSTAPRGNDDSDEARERRAKERNALEDNLSKDPKYRK